MTSTQMGILPLIWVCHTEAHVMSVRPDSKSQPKARNFQRKSKKWFPGFGTSPALITWPKWN